MRTLVTGLQFTLVIIMPMLQQVAFELGTSLRGIVAVGPNAQCGFVKAFIILFHDGKRKIQLQVSVHEMIHCGPAYVIIIVSKVVKLCERYIVFLTIMLVIDFL